MSVCVRFNVVKFIDERQIDDHVYGDEWHIAQMLKYRLMKQC